MTRIAVRLCVVVSALAGAAVAAPQGGGALAGAALGALLGGGAVGLEACAASASLDALVWGATGGVLGLWAGALVGVALVVLAPAAPGALLGLPVLLGAYVGAAIALRRLPDLARVSARLLPGAPRRGGRDRILDTSVIVDGRIADVCATGAVDGALVVSELVLRELQRIADSPDPLRRSRGRRGFDVLERLKRTSGVALELVAAEAAGVEDVDGRLVALARARGGALVTTDYNLGRLAELQGVPVLNVNELALALRPAVLPGETMSVPVVREGKEPGQGVGYLDDGTMVVVEQGKRHLGQTLDVVVTSVLQTPAGRMIFSRPAAEAQPVGSHDG